MKGDKRKMENLNFKYSLSPEAFKKGMLAAGAYKPQRGKQILITVLCLFIVFNSVSAIVSLALQGKQFDFTQLIFVAIGIAATAYIWISPAMMLKNAMKTHLETEELEVTATEEGFEVKGNQTVLITKENYVGLARNKGFVVVYHDRTYIAIPEEEISEEIIEKIGEYFEKLIEIPASPKDDYDNPEFGIWSPETAKSALEEEKAEGEENKEEPQEEKEGENLSDE